MWSQTTCSSLGARVVRTQRMRVLRVGKPDEWGAIGLLLALEAQNFREFFFHTLRGLGRRRVETALCLSPYDMPYRKWQDTLISYGSELTTPAHRDTTRCLSP
jgi:hypothetical protein